MDRVTNDVIHVNDIKNNPDFKKLSVPAETTQHQNREWVKIDQNSTYSGENDQCEHDQNDPDDLNDLSDWSN